MGEPEMQVRIYDRQVEVVGRPVTYRVAGSGEPVVLVHGLAGSMRWWARTVPALASRHTVYLVDLPGFGSMRRAPGGFVLKESASWLVAWMRALDLGQAHLVGHSMGGYICLQVAIEEPEAARCLVLVDPAWWPHGRSMFGPLWPLVQECLLPPNKLLPMLVHDALRAGPLTLWRAARDLLAQDALDDLRSARSSTLLVWGEDDALVPASIGLVLRREIPRSRLLLIKGARHVPMIDRPDIFNQALLSFLAGQPVG
ncbi:MAG: alpha/beta fold hydrolase, partial [Chloroflexia bacterium]